MKITAKQERFCQEIVKGASQSDAYRLAFNPQRAKAKTIHEEASRVMADPKVSARITELMAPIIAKVQLTREEWVQDAVRLYRGDVRKLYDEHGNPVEISDLADEEAALIEGFEVVEDFTKVKKCNGSTDAVPTGYTKKFKLTSKKVRHEYVGKALGYYVEKREHEIDLGPTLEELVLGSMNLEEEKKRK